MADAYTISREAETSQKIKAQLLEAYPELADDEQTLMDTLEGLTDFDEVAEEALRAAVEWQEQAKAATALAGRYTARARALKGRAERTRAAILAAMLELGKKKISGAMTITVAKGTPSVVITDESALPENFIRTERKPIKADIKEALARGDEVPGASLSNAQPRLQTRI